MVGGPRDGRSGVAGDGEDHDPPAAERGDQLEELGGLPALREKDGRVPGRYDAEVAVNRVNGVDERSRRAGAGEGCRDLLRHEARLADAQGQNLPLHLSQRMNRSLELSANSVLELAERLPLDLEDLPRPLNDGG